MNAKTTEQAGCAEGRTSAHGTIAVLSVLLAVTATVLVWTGKAWGQDDGSARQQTLVTEALVYDIQRHSRLDVLTKLHAYHTLVSEGRDDKSIRKELHAINRRFARSAATSGANPAMREAWGTFTGIAGGTITRSWQVGAAAKVVGGQLADVYHEATGPGLQARSEQRRAHRLLGEGARATVEKALAACAKNATCMRDFRTRFGTRVGPGDDMERIARQIPELAEFKAVLEIQNAQERNRALIKLTHEKIQSAQAELAQAIDAGRRETLAGHARLEGKLDAEWIRERRHEHAQRAAAIAQVKMDGLQSAAYIASTLVGFVDPTAGRQLGAVAQATFEIYGAVKKFQAATKLADGLEGFAGAALTGNVLGAGLALIAAFVDMGPTPEEVILEEIGKLREQVQTLHQDMHGRFDRVDFQLNAIFEGIDNGFRVIHRQLNEGNAETWRRLAKIQRELEEHADKLQGIRHSTISQGEMIVERLDATEIESCVRRKETFGTRPNETWFVECLGNIRALATSGHLEQLQLTERDGNPTNNIIEFPDRSTQLAVRKMAAMRSQNSPLSLERLVGPLAWRTLADAQDQIMADWPEYANIVTGESYGKVMAEYRTELISVADAIAEDYAQFEVGEPSAFGTWFKRLRELLEDLEERVESTIDRTAMRRQDINELRWNIAYLGPYDGNNRSTMYRYISDWAWERTYPPANTSRCGDRSIKLPRVEARGPSWMTDAREENLYKTSTPERWKKRIRKRTRGALEAGNPGLVNMINMGMVRISACMGGSSRTEIVPREEEGIQAGGGNREKRWSLNQDALVIANLRIEIDCEDETVVEELEGYHEVEHSYDVVTVEHDWNGGKAPQRIRAGIKHAHALKDASDSAIDDLVGELEEENNSLMGVKEHACRQALEERYHRARVRISRDAAEVLSRSNEWKSLRKEIGDANAYISAWLRIAGGDAQDMPTTVDAILSGAGLLPSPDSLLSGNVRSRETYLWDVPARLRAEVARFEALLGSQQVSRWMERGGGSLDLRRTAYLGIDKFEGSDGS